MIRIKSKNYIVRDFEISDINSSFINALNSKIILKNKGYYVIIHEKEPSPTPSCWTPQRPWSAGTARPG